jgi:hypothetical protein
VFGFGPIDKPVLLIEWGITRLHPYVDSTAGVNMHPYERISYSLGIILFGLVGVVLGRFVALNDDRPSA